eukprot:5803209-Pleurochrysis_carterae.AAC.8
MERYAEETIPVLYCQLCYVSYPFVSYICARETKAKGRPVASMRLLRPPTATAMANGRVGSDARVGTDRRVGNAARVGSAARVSGAVRVDGAAHVEGSTTALSIAATVPSDAVVPTQRALLVALVSSKPARQYALLLLQCTRLRSSACPRRYSPKTASRSQLSAGSHCAQRRFARSARLQGSARAAAGGPSTAVGEPRVAAGEARAAAGKPRKAVGAPHAAAG